MHGPCSPIVADGSKGGVAPQPGMLVAVIAPHGTRCCDCFAGHSADQTNRQSPEATVVTVTHRMPRTPYGFARRR